MSTPADVAIVSILSDAQELMNRGLYKEANRHINYAKFLAMNLLYEVEPVDHARLERIREQFEEQYPEK